MPTPIVVRCVNVGAKGACATFDKNGPAALDEAIQSFFRPERGNLCRERPRKQYGVPFATLVTGDQHARRRRIVGITQTPHHVGIEPRQVGGGGEPNVTWAGFLLFGQIVEPGQHRCLHIRRRRLGGHNRRPALGNVTCQFGVASPHDGDDAIDARSTPGRNDSLDHRLATARQEQFGRSHPRTDAGGRNDRETEAAARAQLAGETAGSPSCGRINSK